MISTRRKSPSWRPPQSPSQSKKLSVFLFIFKSSAFKLNSIEMEANEVVPLSNFQVTGPSKSVSVVGPSCKKSVQSISCLFQSSSLILFSPPRRVSIYLNANFDSLLIDLSLKLSGSNISSLKYIIASKIGSSPGKRSNASSQRS